MGVLANLEGVLLSGLPKLEDASDLKYIESLLSVFFENCKAVNDYSFLGNNKNLRELVVYKSANLNDLTFIENLDDLRRLAFGNGTKISNGDVSPILKLRHIKHCRFTNSKDYNLTEKDILGKLGISNDPDILSTIWNKPSANLE